MPVIKSAAPIPAAPVSRQWVTKIRAACALMAPTTMPKFSPIPVRMGMIRARTMILFLMTRLIRSLATT